MSRLHFPVLVSLLSGVVGMPALASAGSVCVAKADTPVVSAAVVGEGTPIGFVGPRQCFGVLERLEGRTRVLLKGGGFRGEVEIADDHLLYELAEDVPMRLRAKDEPFGLALAGTGVMIEKSSADGVVVRTVDGRVQARFLVEDGVMLPAESWPTMEPDEVHPGGKWPEAEHALPPSSVTLTGKSGARAIVGPPLFALSEVLIDPAIGALRYTVTDADQEDAETVRIVGPTFWVMGTVEDIDWRRLSIKGSKDDENAPDEDGDGLRDGWDGWDEHKGYAVSAPVAPHPREVASKEAPLAFEAKGDRFAVLIPGARVRVVQTDGPWLQVEHVWAGGTVTGWLDKKRLIKEGKEQTTPQVALPKATVVTVGEPVLAWVNKGPEQATDKDGEPKVDKEGEPVVDPNETHIEEPDYATVWLRRMLRERIDRLRYFYGRELAGNPTATGAMTLSITIDEEGVFTTELVDVTLQDDDLKELVGEMLAEYEPEERKIKKSRRDTKDYSLSLKVTVTFAPLK
ncbi:MAG: hypothetical protein KDA24_08855 [Deltaproteobacteria bacterium]|nr:hypothetical protein [Deltaproteobacteria bacterium]